MKIDTNPERIEDFLTRGVSALYPSKEFIKDLMLSGKQLSMYIGVDPTGPTLHIGHMISLMKLSEFQKMGHKVIFLIGSFTGMIGDPTGRNSIRKQLTREEVLKNCEKYKEQASIFLNFEGDNPVELRYNSEWHDKLTFRDVINIASHFTVSQMLERDMFQERIKNNQPIGLHEFLYPLMQGYDSVVLGVDGEIGGNDQIFNMLCGRTLMKDLKNREKFVVAMKLLIDPSGKKMGKSEGNMISLIGSSKDMFGKVMSWPDEMIYPGFELCTQISTKDLSIIEDKIKSNENPRDLKLQLAYEIVKIYFGEEIAKQEMDNFISQFSNKDLPNNMEDVEIDKRFKNATEVISTAFNISKTSARKMIEQGAVKIYYNGEMKKIIEPNKNVEINNDMVLQLGKLKYKRIKVKNV
ncbi:MAG TPA: tyrosine--tRNA ligase [bacterium]|nr:tyrosine--tRNA ligase [Patescibacteria group bacterium]HPO11448.1 tyrosine--tRNA ligase [bacterium]